MKILRSPVLRLFLLCCFVLWAKNAAAQNIYPKDVQQRIKKVETGLSGWAIGEGITTATIAEKMKQYHVKGLSIAVIKNYKIDWAKAYGWADSAEKRRVTTATLFQAGSISKSLNAIGILKLVQDGKLDLYTDINTYLKSWQFPYDSLSIGKKITVYNLLTHSAGLSVHGFGGYEKGEPLPTLVQVLDGKKPENSPPVRSEFAPSLKYQYSGGGTTISQLIVQDVTKQPYAAYMWNYVLKPMGMTSSSYDQPPLADKKLLATGYENDGKEIKGKYHIYPEQAAAGLWTNPTDLAKYIIETQLALQGKSAKVLNRQTTKMRLSPYLGDAGLGVFLIRDSSYFSHSGVDEGFVSIYMGSIDGGDGLVIMNNAANGAIFDELIQSVSKVYGWKHSPPQVVKKIVRPAEEILKTYEGEYAIQNEKVKIVLRNHALWAEPIYAFAYPLYFTSNTEFFSEPVKGEFQFFRNDKGQVTFKRTDAKTAVTAQVLPAKSIEADQLNDKAWEAIQNNQLERAKNYLNEALIYFPDLLDLNINLAHVYLFSNQYEMAMGIYKTHIGQKFPDGTTWESTIKSDLTYLQSKGLPEEPIKRVFKELRLN